MIFTEKTRSDQMMNIKFLLDFTRSVQKKSNHCQYNENGLHDIDVTGSQGDWTGMRMCEQ